MRKRFLLHNKFIKLQQQRLQRWMAVAVAAAAAIMKQFQQRQQQQQPLGGTGTSTIKLTNLIKKSSKPHNFLRLIKSINIYLPTHTHRGRQRYTNKYTYTHIHVQQITMKSCNQIDLLNELQEIVWEKFIKSTKTLNRVIEVDHYKKIFTSEICTPFPFSTFHGKNFK